MGAKVERTNFNKMKCIFAFFHVNFPATFTLQGKKRVLMVRVNSSTIDSLMSLMTVVHGIAIPVDVNIP